MKQSLYIIILMTIFIGCKTTPTSSPTDKSEIQVTVKNLTGQWKWIKSVDSLNQVVDKPTSDITRTIMITQDTMYKEFCNDTIVIDHKFRLYKVMTNYSADSLSVIDYLGSAKYFHTVVFSLTPKTLIVGFFPRYKRVFSRIN